MVVGEVLFEVFLFFFSSRRRHTRYWRDWSSDVCSSDLLLLTLCLGLAKLALEGLYRGGHSRSPSPTKTHMLGCILQHPVRHLTTIAQGTGRGKLLQAIEGVREGRAAWTSTRGRVVREDRKVLLRGLRDPRQERFVARRPPSFATPIPSRPLSPPCRR